METIEKKNFLTIVILNLYLILNLRKVRNFLFFSL